MQSTTDRCTSDGAALYSNIFDTALIFEGGGMRASYTSAVVNTLLEQHLFFDNVYGLSAGSSNTVNYLSRDTQRTKQSFVDFVLAPDFAGMKTFLSHKGFFNAHMIYEEACKPDAFMPFDFATFSANPAHATIESFERDTGRSVYWTKDDMSTLNDLMVRVRASSTLPLAMPSPAIDGNRYYDGGLGEGAGFLLPKAQQDGFKRFFIVRTQPKDYRKTPPAGLLPKLMNVAFCRRPHVRHALERRWRVYNELCDYMEQLEAEGSAYVFYPRHMEVSSATTDLGALQKSYDDGWAQAHEELPAMLRFLQGHTV